ncbi:MAG: hypothetical protein AB7E95_08020 [Kiritimatiellales bacterium]
MNIKSMVGIIILMIGLCPRVVNAVLIAYDPFLNANVAGGGNRRGEGEYNAGSQFRDFTNGNNNNVTGGPIVGWSALAKWTGNSGAAAGANDKIIGPTDSSGLSFGRNRVQGGNVQARGAKNKSPNNPDTVSFARRSLDSYAGNSVYYISALMRADTATIRNNLNINAMVGFSAEMGLEAFDGSGFAGAIFGFHGNGRQVDLVVRYRDISGKSVNSVIISKIPGGITYFVVLKLEYNAEDDNERLTVWLNPQSPNERGTDPVLVATGSMLSSETQLTTGGFWMNNFNSGINDYVRFDELRLGTEWSDVVAVTK